MYVYSYGWFFSKVKLILGSHKTHGVPSSLKRMNVVFTLPCETLRVLREVKYIVRWSRGRTNFRPDNANNSYT